MVVPQYLNHRVIVPRPLVRTTSCPIKAMGSRQTYSRAVVLRTIDGRPLPLVVDAFAQIAQIAPT